MEDKRSSPRRRVNDDIEVIDSNSGERLGHLGNISIGGFMLLANAPPEIGRLFQVRLEMPTPIDGHTRIVLGAECLWCEEAVSGGQIWAGFQIIDIADDAAMLIERLVNAWTG